MADHEYKIKIKAENEAEAGAQAAVGSLKKVNDAAKQYAAEQKAAAKQLAEAQRALSKQLADVQKAEAKAKADAIIAIDKGMLTNAQVQAEAIKKVFIEANQARIKSAQDVVRAEVFGFKASGEAAAGFGDGLGKLAVQAFGLRTVLQVSKAIIGPMEDGVKAARDMAESVTKMRAGLRDISAIKGTMGVSDADVKAHLDLRKSTGMSESQANEFSRSFLGTAELFKGRQIDNEEYDPYMKKLGRYASANNVNRTVAGELGGSVLGMADFKGAGGSDRAIEELAGTYEILQQTKGDVNTLADATGRIGATYANEDASKGPLRSSREAAAMVGRFAIASPGRAVSLSQQYMRAVTDMTGKQSDALKGIGIQYGDRLYGKGDEKGIEDKLFAHLDSEQAKGKTTQQAIDDMGFENAEEKESIRIAYQNRGSGQDLIDMAHRKTSPGATNAKVDAAYASTSGKDLRLGQAQARAAEADSDLGKPGEELVRWRLDAKTQLKSEGAIGPQSEQWGNFARGLRMSPLSGNYTEHGEQYLIDERVRANLRKSGVETHLPSDDASTPGVGMMARGAEMAGGQVDATLGAAAWQAEMAGHAKRTADAAERTANATEAAGKAPLPAGPPAERGR